MGIEDWKLTVHKKAANCHLMVDVMKGKEDREADLIVCGIGISRFDMPILAYRCNELGVANNADVWDQQGV